MDKLTEQIRNRYCQLKREDNNDQEEQVALYAKKGGKLKCNHCSKTRHLSKNCWELEKNNNKKAKYFKKRSTNNKDGKNNNQKEINSYNCGKAGHIKKYCRLPKKNDDNKNNKNKQQDGKALNTIDKEFVLMSLSLKMETK